MKTTCFTCMHRCSLAPGQTGRCRARKNEGGRVVSANYGLITSMALDPIEKKPLAMFHPGSQILSVGSFGCNLSCPFCQNHQISMAGPGDVEAVYIGPGELARKAASLAGMGNIGVAYTYNEPLVGYEYVVDAAKEVGKLGMKNVVVTNGSATSQVEEAVLPWVDAMNIDLKGFTQEYYHKLGGCLDTVKAFIKEASGRCHVELATLVVPGENDREEEMEELAGWVASIDPGIPLHVTRFFPRWKMEDRRATQVEWVCHLAQVARKHLNHVFIGNC